MLWYVNGQIVDTDGDHQWVDLSKYDVVEKKEAKINRLQESLNGKLQFVTYFKELVDGYAAKVIEYNKDIEKIKAELKELEK
jgi:hypothetical protein